MRLDGQARAEYWTPRVEQARQHARDMYVSWQLALANLARLLELRDQCR